MRRFPWVQIVAYALLAAAAASTALALSSLGVMNDPHVSGAGPGYRYGSLGIERRTGPDFRLGTTLIDKLSRVLPRSIGIGGALGYSLDFKIPNSSRTTTAKISIQYIAGDYMQMLHLQPLAGHLLTTADVRDGSHVIVISDKIARHLFGSAAKAVGHTLESIGSGSTPGVGLRVVGVLPDTFGGIWIHHDAQAWVPFTLMPAFHGFALPSIRGKTADEMFSLSGMAVMFSAPKNLTRIELQSKLQQAWLRLPASVVPNGALGLLAWHPYSVFPYARLAAARRIHLYLELAIAALFLATINVFTLNWLMLMRRRDALQMEIILGATRLHLRRRFLRSTAIIALLILALTTLLAASGYLLTKHLLPVNSLWSMFTTQAVLVRLIWILPLLVLIVVIAQAFPLAPFVFRPQFSRLQNVSAPLADRYIGVVILIMETLLAAVMSCAAAWALVNAWQMLHAELGMLNAPTSVVSITAKPEAAPFKLSIGSAAENANNLALVAVEQAVNGVWPKAKVGIGPLPSHRKEGLMHTIHAGNRATAVCQHYASRGWIDAAGVHLLAGVNFNSAAAQPDVLLIDSQVARKLFGSTQAAIGKAIDGVEFTDRPQRVLGVFPPLRLNGLNHTPCPMVLLNLRNERGAGFHLFGGNLFIRPEVPLSRQASLRSMLDAAVRRSAPSLEIKSIQSDSAIHAQLAAPQTRQAEIFAVIALFAWAIALSGVASHLRLYLAMRKRLAAIRSALGAGPRRLYSEVLGGTLAMALAGIVLSLLAAPWLAQQFAFLSGAQVSPFGAATWIALAVLLLAVFLVAHFPARRAARAEPAQSLHEL